MPNLNIIPTAEEFLNNFNKENYNIDKLYYDSYVRKIMIEFAKLHVEAALKAVSENVRYREQITMQGVQRTFNVNSILNAYPLTNIK